MRLTTHRQARRAIAATEMAMISPVIILLLAGVWEIGRVIMVRNLLNEAAREGARLAGSAGYFASSNHTNPTNTAQNLTLISPSTNGDYEVQKKVIIYLQAASVNPSGAKVTVKNLGGTGGAKTWSYTWDHTAGNGTGTGYDPAAAADQHDKIEVTVTVPYANVGWSPLNLFIAADTTLTATVDWASMRDIPLTVSTTIPTRPLQPTDDLP
jgi:Flp pilus assembly protein TadG